MAELSLPPCRCDGPMPVPDTTGESEIGAMCFGCDRPMDEESCRGLYEDGPPASPTKEAPDHLGGGS